jgi:L-aspartate oxidase
LASNSLLEGLVFGARAAETMLTEAASLPAKMPDSHPVAAIRELGIASPDQAAARTELRCIMWRDAGLLRDAEGLDRAAALLARLGATLEPAHERASLELRNLHAVATLITRAALAREESRGGHFRSDFPVRDDAHFQKHSRITGEHPPEFVSRTASSDLHHPSLA